MLTSWPVWVVLGYLCGSVPFGLLIGLLKGVDIRRSGSGNVGATNAGRVLGRWWGVFCLVLDVGKGAAPVFASGVVMGVGVSRDQDWWWLAVGVAAVVGHVFPVWLRFKGGKGVATGLGVLLGYWPVLTLPAVAAAVVWGALLALFRYVSVASVAAAVVVPVTLAVVTLARGASLSSVQPFLVATGVLAALVAVRHRGNFARLIAGIEPRIGEPAEKDPPITA